MHKVYVNEQDVGVFTPATQGRSGNVYSDTDTIGTFNFQYVEGNVKVNLQQVGVYSGLLQLLRYTAIPLKYTKLHSLIIRNNVVVRRITSLTPFEPEGQTRIVVQGIQHKTNKRTAHIKAKWDIKVKRNGLTVYHKKRTRDLMVWKGQSIIAYLLSQGAIGTETATWKAVASENSNAPDMSDDSGNPEANEFNPLIGTPVDVTYEFIPQTAPSGGYQNYAELSIKGTVISDGAKTIRKIGIIDSVAVPDRNIIVEDLVVPYNLELNDEIDVTYTIQLG